jgi:hypothetical protein
LASTKREQAWQQGTFGIGGNTTYRNADAVILVSRQAPETLQPGEEDRIAVAVLEWELQGKTPTAYYLVTEPWRKYENDPPVFSVSATEYPDFKPGTHLALISYSVEHIYVTNFGDERSLYTLASTRLFEPVLPIGMDRAGGSRQNVRGLKMRLLDNPGEPPRPTVCETLPFRYEGETYHLPLTYHVFSAPNEEGSRRKYAAPGHVVVFTSNGQTHHQWNISDFRNKMPTLQRLADRVFVIVETDELPIQLRTTLFTADRSGMMRTPHAMRLEREVAAFIQDWDALKDINGELVRKALSDGQTRRSTVNLAREIGKAFQNIGYGVGISKRRNNGNGQTGAGLGAGRPGGPTYDLDLLREPTILEGPETVIAVAGQSKFIRFRLNAVNEFLRDSSVLRVTTDSEFVTPREITIGQLSNGRLRIALAVPEDAPEAEFSLKVIVPQWIRKAGGMGGPLEWTTRVDVRATAPELGSSNRGTGKQAGQGGKGDQPSAAGDIVPVIWKADNENWTPLTVGSAEQMRACDVAAARPEYQELEPLGDQLIWVISLHENYVPYKKYSAASVRDVTDRTRESRQHRYALGVGTAMLAFEIETRKLREKGEPVNDQVLELARQAMATAVLTDLKAYDQLASEAGLDKQEENKETAEIV